MNHYVALLRGIKKTIPIHRQHFRGMRQPVRALARTHEFADAFLMSSVRVMRR